MSTGNAFRDSNETRKELSARVNELQDELGLQPVDMRIPVSIAVAEKLFPAFEDLDILDIGCGHNFPVISWFQDNNAGPFLAGYLSSRGANVTGLDEWHFTSHREFKGYGYRKKRGDAGKIGEYFNGQEFDMVFSVAYFGYPSSKNGVRPDWEYEFSILKQVKDVTKDGGYGVHLLLDGYWQLCRQDLDALGYTTLKYLGDNAGNLHVQDDPVCYDNLIVLQNPGVGKQ